MAEKITFDKYVVRRADREDRPGYKHAGCVTFTLDLTHDWHARIAVLAYARSLELNGNKEPGLVNDLRQAVQEATGRPWQELDAP
jgi:hypothetical protein